MGACDSLDLVGEAAALGHRTPCLDMEPTCTRARVVDSWSCVVAIRDRVVAHELRRESVGLVGKVAARQEFEASCPYFSDEDMRCVRAQRHVLVMTLV